MSIVSSVTVQDARWKSLKTFTLNKDSVVVQDRYSDFVHMLQNQRVLTRSQVDQGPSFLTHTGHVWGPKSAQTISQVTGIGQRAPNKGLNNVVLTMIPSDAVLVRYIDSKGKLLTIAHWSPNENVCKSSVADVLAGSRTDVGRRNCLAGVGSRGDIWLQTSDQLHVLPTVGKPIGPANATALMAGDRDTLQSKFDLVVGRQNVLPMITIVQKDSPGMTGYMRRFGFVLFMGTMIALFALVVYPWVELDA